MLCPAKQKRHFLVLFSKCQNASIYIYWKQIYPYKKVKNSKCIWLEFFCWRKEKKRNRNTIGAHWTVKKNKIINGWHNQQVAECNENVNVNCTYNHNQFADKDGIYRHHAAKLNKILCCRRRRRRLFLQRRLDQRVMLLTILQSPICQSAIDCNSLVEAARCKQASKQAMIIIK